jgi:signal transduction histidine kinase
VSASRAKSAVRLPWLAPGASALAALLRSDFVAVDRHLRCDPGFALLWLRAGAPPLHEDTDYTPLMRGALNTLHRTPAGRLDESLPPVAVVLEFARQCAHVAGQLANRRGFTDQRRAAVAGLLVPLGWLAIAAVDPSAIEDCLTDNDHANVPGEIQERYWGATASTLTRQLARHWDLPVWLAAAIGNLDLPSAWVDDVGGDAALSAVVHDALRVLARSGDPLGLGISLPRKNVSATEFDGPMIDGAEPLDDPYAAPFLRDALSLAIDRGAGYAESALERLEIENEALRDALRTERSTFAERLQAQKLAALAEFAAGAGHEINNPLAVISGQAQYLLIKETEPDREKALHVVVQQAQRIHQILTDLMQFARPAKPQKRGFDLRDAARTVATNLHEFAALQRVRIELITPDEPCPIEADPKHVQTALASLLRNAIEAAPEDGWARITLELLAESLQVVVEDSGDGPTPAQREHLFDPFYSGRLAGRGRGLGLATAWRLAKEQGGDVAFDPKSDSLARFVLTLPRSADQLPAIERKSA